MDKTNLVVAVVAVVSSNGVSIGAMVWKLSGYFHKLQSQLDAMVKTTEITNKFVDDRMKAQEAHSLKMFELIYDLQKRTTTVEVRIEKGQG